MAIIDELLFDRVVELDLFDPATGELKLRLTNVREGSVNTSTEGEEITDGTGSPITTLYNAKRGTISGTNALFSLGLAAAQFGSTKQVASASSKIVTPRSEVLTASGGKLTLSKTPVNNSVKYIYKLESKQLADKLELDTTATTGKFSITGTTITLPNGSDGKYLVEYEYESTTANKISNSTESQPETYVVKMKCLFRNPCNDNEKFGGWIVAQRGKMSPESVEIGLSRTGGHAFEIVLNKEYCDEEANLLDIIVDNED